MTDANVSDKLMKERQLALDLLNTKGNRSSRLCPPSTTTDLNFNISELYADRTQEVQLTPSKNDNYSEQNDHRTYDNEFEPKEISGRSTDFTSNSIGNSAQPVNSFQLKHFVTPGLDEIFKTSICEDVREMGRTMSRISSARESLESLPKTADIDSSPDSSESSLGDWNKRGYNNDWLSDAVNNPPQVGFEDEFESGDGANALSKIIHDQRDWEKEFADIPSVSPQQEKQEAENLFKLPELPVKLSKLKGKLTNHADLGDFSGYLEFSNETQKAFEESRRNFSMGEYFLKNSHKLGEICPGVKSPPKRYAVPLIDSMTEHSWLKETSQVESSGKVSKKSKDKENTDPNNLSVSTILKVMQTLNLNDTPHTVVQKFISAKGTKNHLTANQPKKNDILSSTIKSSDGVHNPFESESVTTLDETAQKSPENIRMASSSVRTPEKPTLIPDDSGNGRSQMTSHDIPELPLTPRNSKKQHSKFDHIHDSPSSIASSLERTDEIDRAMLAGKLSLPAYPVTPKTITRTASQCSTSSEFRPSDGTFPIKTSCKEVAWNCVKLQEKVSKEVTIKNTCDKHVSMMVTISGPGFQCSLIGKQRLAKLECRTFTIDFCPTVKGPATGYLSFQLQGSSLTQHIGLFGYGGKSNVKIRGLEIPPSGDKYLCMGTMKDLNRTMEQYIEIGNRGDTDAFILVAFETDTKSLNTSFYPSTLHITPQRFRMPVSRSGSVKISYTPTKSEARHIAENPQETFIIARVSVIYGDWATRNRLKAVAKIVTIKNQTINKICEPFRDEKSERMNQDSGEQFFDNPWEAVQSCTDTFNHTDFVLTINKSPDETVNFSQAIGEQSILFKSMLTDEMRHYRIDSDHFPLIVTPSSLHMGLNEEVEIKLKNNSKRTETFEMSSEFKSTFKFRPAEGQINPGEDISVDVTLCYGDSSYKSEFYIFVANGKLTVPVTIKPFFK